MSDINIIENSIWPTTDGRLGINKVPIPDGVNTFWPEGNALVKNFIYKDDKLVGYIDTKSLIENESKTSVLPYEYVDITLDKRLEYSMTIEKGENCKYFNIKYESSLPSEYKRLEYLESTGEQYIDTEVNINGTSGVLGLFEPVGATPNNWAISAGAYKSYAFSPLIRYRDNVGFQYKNSAHYPLKDGTWVTSGAQAGNLGYKLREKCQVALNWLNDHQWSLKFNTGRVVYSALPNMSGLNNTLYLFARHYENGAAERERVRIYKIQLSQGEQGTNTFIPALDPTGAPCMFDLVAREPFYNSGTGDFIYPNMETQATTYSLRNYMYAKMTEHGIRRLYHVPINYSGTKEDYASESGFKQLVELPRPEEGNWIPNWIETDTELICDWIEIEEEIPSEN